MDLAEHYKWEAETHNGQIVQSGRNLRGCVRLSLIPCVPGLPRHDFVGIQLRQRFCRGFFKTRLAGRQKLPGLLFWQKGSDIVRTSHDLTGNVKPGDFIGKGNAGRRWYAVRAVFSDHVILTSEYEGRSRPEGYQGFKFSGFCRPYRFYFHCIETQGERIWVDASTGGIRVTPKNFELYL